VGVEERGEDTRQVVGVCILHHVNAIPSKLLDLNYSNLRVVL
jgi:hypothetical protein